MGGVAVCQNSHSYPSEVVSDGVTAFERMIPKDEYPYLHEHGCQQLAEGPQQDVSAFEYGLDFILEGLTEVREQS